MNGFVFDAYSYNGWLIVGQGHLHTGVHDGVLLIMSPSGVPAVTAVARQIPSSINRAPSRRTLAQWPRKYYPDRF